MKAKAGDRAERVLTRELASRPDDDRLRLKLAELYVQRGRIADAVREYRLAADGYAKNGSYLKAVAVYNRILNLDGSQVDVRVRLGDYYRHLGILDDALIQYQTAAKHFRRQRSKRRELDGVQRKIFETASQALAASGGGEPHGTVPVAVERERGRGSRGAASRAVGPSILVLHGPNLNLLGIREPDVYGTTTLEEIDAALKERAQSLGAAVVTFQSNHEGTLIDRIHAAREKHHGIVVNAGALTHTSVALRDAVAAAGLPAIEVHLTNPFRREPFRRRSHLAGVVVGRVEGFGPEGYLLGFEGLVAHLRKRP